MANNEMDFFEMQFPDNDERRTMALDDQEIQNLLRETSPSGRVVSGDALVALERLAAERYGLDPLETSRLLEEFWGLREIERKRHYG